MMYIRYFKIIFPVVALATFLSGCQELYLSDNMDGSHKIPVVQGGITDQPGPYRVALSWSKPFTSESLKTEGIKGAKVYISDDAGTTEKLTEGVNGEYLTSANGIKGTFGRTYSLRIEFPNGLIYESVPAKLENAPTIDSLYAETGELVTGFTNSNNQFVKKVYQGIYVYADIKLKTDTIKYFKFDNTTIWQAASIPQSINEKTKYFRIIINSDNLPNIKSSVQEGEYQLVKKQQIAFLYNYLNDSVNPSVYRNAGWIVCPAVKTIPVEIYNYYKDVHQQLGAGLEIFDPVPAQIRGNVFCKNDPAQVVNGKFEVSSQFIMYKAFNWSASSGEIKTKTVDYPGPLTNTLNVGNKPLFWVNF